jgi:hypothetical protein
MTGLLAAILTSGYLGLDIGGSDPLGALGAGAIGAVGRTLFISFGDEPCKKRRREEGDALKSRDDLFATAGREVGRVGNRRFEEAIEASRQ